MESEHPKGFLHQYWWLILMLHVLFLAVIVFLHLQNPIFSGADRQAEDAPVAVVADPSDTPAAMEPEPTLVPTEPAPTILPSTETPSMEISPKVGALAPELELTDLNGSTDTLSAYLGKTVLLYAFGVGCGYCRAEAESLEALYQAYKEDDFVIIAVNAWADDEMSIAAFAEQYGFTFPVWTDPTSQISRIYQTNGAVPLNCFINEDGVVTNYILGMMSYDQLSSEVERTLSN